MVLQALVMKCLSTVEYKLLLQLLPFLIDALHYNKFQNNEKMVIFFLSLKNLYLIEILTIHIQLASLSILKNYIPKFLLTASTIFFHLTTFLIHTTMLPYLVTVPITLSIFSIILLKMPTATIRKYGSSHRI